jgi:hypothetical protein
MAKLLFGVGINDWHGQCQSSVGGKNVMCPYYSRWTQMLRRCYDKKFLLKYPTYSGCVVSSEWLSFSVFREWMEKQSWQGKHLDKDIIASGNKVYSEATCAFVHPATNLFMNKNEAMGNNLPTGVHWSRKDKKFLAQCSDPFKKTNVFLGYFESAEEASIAYFDYKHSLAVIIAGFESDQRVVDALMTRYAKH